MTRIGIRRHVPLCFALLACLPLGSRVLPASDIFTQIGKKAADRNGARPRNENALERSPYCLGGAFYLIRNSRFGGVGSQKSGPKPALFP